MAKSFLGELEQAIMDTVWTGRAWTVRQVLEAIKHRRRVAYTTVMTVMNRLVDQHVLQRDRGQDGAFRYTACRSREDYCSQATRQSVNQLVRLYGDAALAQFMEKLDTIPSTKLHQLRRKLRPSSR